MKERVHSASTVTAPDEIYFESMMHSSPDAVVCLDESGRITYCNQQVEILFGWSAESIRNKNFSRVFLSGVQQLHFDRLINLSLSGDESRILKKPVTMEVTASGGETKKASLFISLLRQTRKICIYLRFPEPEQKPGDNFILRDETFRALIDHSYNAIGMMNEKGEVIYRSPSTQQLIGYTLEEMKGRKMIELMHPDDVPSTLKFYDEVFNSPGVPKNKSHRLLHKDGYYIWVEGTVTNFLHVESIKAIMCSFRDISEQKKIENKLKATSEQLRLIFDTLEISFWGFDAVQNQMLYVSPGNKKVYGYEAYEFYSNPHLWSDVILAEDKKTLKRINTLLYQGKSTSVEYRIRHSDGSTHWIEGRMTPTLDQEGKLLRIDGTAADITDRKKAEEDLIQSELRYRSLFEQASDAIMITETSGVIVDVNTTTCQKLGFSREEFLKMNVVSLFDNEQLEAQPLQYDLVKAGQTVLKERRMRCKDGSCIDVQSNSKMLPDGRVLSITRDVTERNKAKDELMKSELKYRSLFEQASDAIMVTDFDGNFVDVNASLCNMFGYTKDELLQMNVRGLIDPEQLKSRPMDFSRIKADIHVFSERRMLAKNGNIVDVEANIKKFGDNLIHAIVRDVTEMRKVQHLVEVSESTFRGAFEFSNLGMSIISLDGRWMKVNKRMCELTGYTKKELLNMSFREITHPDDLKRNNELFDKATHGALDSFRMEKKFIHKNGRVVWVNHYASVIKDSQYNRLYMVAQNEDITERKKVELALRESEKRFRNIFENEPECVKITDRDGRLLDMNPAGLAMIEAENLEQVKGQDILALVNKEYHVEFRNMVDEIFKGHPQKLGFEMTGLKGTKRWMETHAVPIYDAHHSIVSMLSVTTDVTRRKITDEKLKEAYDRLHFHINNTPLALIEENRDLKITYWNKRAEEIFGWTAEEMLGRHGHPILDNNEDLPVVDQVLDNLQPDGLNQNPVERRNITKDGKVLCCQWYHSYLRDENGKIVTILSLVRDVTETRMAQQKLSESHEEIKALAKHLVNIREEERTIISREIHDVLGQQLTGLKMDASWLSKKITDDNVKLKQRTADMISLIDEMVKSVRQISAELRPSILDDLGLIDALQWQTNEFEKRTGIKCSFIVLSPDAIFEKNISTGIFRVYQETLTNIARHAGATEMNASLECNEAGIVLKIEDNGKGFNPEKITRNNSLGIVGMRERALILGGEISIVSSYGRGTRVTLTIPEHTDQNNSTSST